MKTFTRIGLLLPMFTLLTLSGCENAEQRKLYDQAVKMEQNFGGDSSDFTVEAYRKVVRLDASSALGREAQGRIDRIQNNINQKKMVRAVEFNSLMNR